MEDGWSASREVSEEAEKQREPGTCKVAGSLHLGLFQFLPKYGGEKPGSGVYYVLLVLRYDHQMAENPKETPGVSFASTSLRLSPGTQRQPEVVSSLAQLDGCQQPAFSSFGVLLGGSESTEGMGDWEPEM